MHFILNSMRLNTLMYISIKITPFQIIDSMHITQHLDSITITSIKIRTNTSLFRSFICYSCVFINDISLFPHQLFFMRFAQNVSITQCYLRSFPFLSKSIYFIGILRPSRVYYLSHKIINILGFTNHLINSNSERFHFQHIQYNPT